MKNQKIDDEALERIRTGINNRNDISSINKEEIKKDGWNYEILFTSEQKELLRFENRFESSVNLQGKQNANNLVAKKIKTKSR